MKCVTHHHACDCREEQIRFICKSVLEDHAQLKKFAAGFKTPEPCKCPVCEAIRKLYQDLE